MHSVKVSWVGQTFALAKCNDSQGKKSRIRKSKEERKTMVDAFIKKYQASNNGNFPSLNLTHKEVGGSFYTVREIVREIIQENKILGPASSSSRNQDINNFAIQNALSLPLTIDLSIEDVTFIYNEHENMSGMLKNEGHGSVQAGAQDALMDHSSDISYSGDPMTLESDRLSLNGSQHEVPAVPQAVVEKGSKTLKETDITSPVVMVEDSITEGMNNASTQIHELMSATSPLASDANPSCYSSGRFEDAESTATMAAHQNKAASMEVDFNFSTVAEATEKNNADKISGGLYFMSTQMTLEDSEAESQNMVAAEAQVHPVAVGDSGATEAVPDIHVDTKLDAFKIPAPNEVVPEQRSSNWEEVNSGLDGTSRLNFVLAIVTCLRKYILIMWVIQSFEKEFSDGQRDKSLLGCN